MKRPSAHILLLLLPTVLLLGGCGTRTIVVPVHRPAVIDMHNCERVAVPSVEYISGWEPMSLMVRQELDAILLPTLAETGAAEFVSVSSTGHGTIMTPQGTLSRSEASAAAQSVDAGCLLICSVVHSSFNEEVLQADIISKENPGGKRFARQGRASCTFRIVVLDAGRETVTFADTVHVKATQERSAINQEPEALDRGALAEDLARRFAVLLADAMRPSVDRQVVTFLVDDRWPALEQAVTFAESGQWPKAETLIREQLKGGNLSENADILWYDLGIALQYQNDFRGAKDAFEKALALNDQGRYRHAIDALLRMEDEYLESLRQQH